MTTNENQLLSLQSDEELKLSSKSEFKVVPPIDGLVSALTMYLEKPNVKLITKQSRLLLSDFFWLQLNKKQRNIFHNSLKASFENCVCSDMQIHYIKTRLIPEIAFKILGDEMLKNRVDSIRHINSRHQLSYPEK